MRRRWMALARMSSADLVHLKGLGFWLKEQIIHGRIYRNIAELRNAVRGFVEQYNAQWIVEKNGYLSPAQARQAWHTAMSLRPAA